MASSPPAPDERVPDDGFATPAAVVISLAMATIAVAVQARAISALHASQADYVQSAAELRLDGAQQLTATALARGTLTSPQDTKLQLGGAAVDAEVQPEAAKLGLASAATLEPASLTALGASSPNQARAGLSRLASLGDADPADLRSLDPSPRWKACGPAAISAYGAGLGAAPPLGANAVAHGGEVWRIAAWDGWGWTDDRLVRVTGDDDAPVRVIFRSFYRNTKGRPACPILSAAAPAA